MHSLLSHFHLMKTSQCPVQDIKETAIFYTKSTFCQLLNCLTWLLHAHLYASVRQPWKWILYLVFVHPLLLYSALGIWFQSEPHLPDFPQRRQFCGRTGQGSQGSAMPLARKIDGSSPHRLANWFRALPAKLSHVGHCCAVAQCETAW